MEGIRIAGMRKEFGVGSAQAIAVENLDLTVPAGTILALLGPSGCGKTTTLRCIAGLETPDQGSISILGQVVYDSAEEIVVEPEKRKIGMVFQSYALWPHKTAFENVAYPLYRQKVPKSEIHDRVMKTLLSVSCDHLSHRYPNQLSGGQQQRIALARALVADPKVILFDEPLSNLDAQLREQMRFELLAMHDRLKFTAVYVTHDQLEAMTIADNVAVMRQGRVVQLDKPRNLYTRAVDRVTAEFMGSTSFIPGIIIRNDGPEHLLTETVFGAVRTWISSESKADSGDRIAICVRPHEFKICQNATPMTPDMEHLWTKGTLEKSVFQGEKWAHIVKVNDQMVRVERSGGDDMDDLEAHSPILIGLPKRTFPGYLA